jgi:hypothetical protein
MRDGTEEDHDQDGQVELEIVIYPGGQVVMPKLPELAVVAEALGDEDAAMSCLAAGNIEVVVGSRKCG